MPCVKRNRLTRPGPEITRSLSTRPWTRDRSSTSASSRGVRAAKSACPASDGDGTNRPLTLWSSASPSPVPAAMSAALPVGTAMPSCSTASSSRLEHRHRVRHRLEIVQELHRASPSRSATTRGVRQPGHVGQPRHQTGHRTGDAEQTASTAARPVSSRNVSDDVVEAVEVERGVFADDLRGAAGRVRAERARAASSCRRRRRRGACAQMIATIRNRPA